MFFTVDPTNGLAIYDQIARQLKFAVADEALKPGEMVPSVRELSRDLAVNPNTVARAFRELQSEGVLAGVRGTGLQVTGRAPKYCRRERLRLIRERLHLVLLEATRSGLPESEIRQLVAEELEELQAKGKP